MEKPAPLYLLVPSPPPETSDKLLKSASSSAVMTIDSGDPVRGCIVRYSGMQLKLSVTTARDMEGFKQVFCNVDQYTVGSAIAISLGDHLAGGEKASAIVKALLVAAAAIGQMTDTIAVIWSPAKTLSGIEYFARTVSEYDQGGAFPVLSLVNFKQEDDGTIRSTGLEWLVGQELRVAPAAFSETETMRRIVRIAHDLAVNGPVTVDTDLGGIEENEAVELRPDGDLLGVRILSIAPQ